MRNDKPVSAMNVPAAIWPALCWHNPMIYCGLASALGVGTSLCRDFESPETLASTGFPQSAVIRGCPISLVPVRISAIKLLFRRNYPHLVSKNP